MRIYKMLKNINEQEKNMENNILIERYRGRLLKVHAATVAIVSFVEIMAYFVFVWLGLHPLSFWSVYLWEGVIIPIVINVIAHICARRKCHKKDVSEKSKNRSVIHAAFVTTFVVSIIHRDYIVTLCAFVFPIILSAMYNDKSILKESVVLALISLTVSIGILLYEFNFDLTTLLNMVVLYGFVAVSYLSGYLSIKFSQSNFAYIEEQKNANANLETKLDLDQMTNLFNHEAFYEKLELVLSDAEKTGKNCCVAMIDIDDFKKVNDTYGHNAGDEVLIVLADILKKCSEGVGYASRYGGEEFGIIFYEKTVFAAKEVIVDALRQFSEYKFDFTNEHYTFSCGIADFIYGDTKETIFDRADDNLYISKHNGKNQITVDKTKCL